MDAALKEPLATTWKDELLQLISRQSLKIPAPIILGSLVVALMVYDVIAPIYWVSWLILEFFAVALRRISFPRLALLNQQSVDKRLRIMILITLLNSVAHGLSLFFFPSLTEIERAVHTLILLLACVGSVVTSNGYRPMLIAYLSPILIPLIILWAINPQIEDAGWTERTMSVLLTLFTIVLFSHSRDLYRLFRESFDIRTQQAELNQRLEDALSVAESANRAKTRFLASASHDLRQPIHAASLFSAALKRRKLDDETREIANHVDQSLQSMVLQLDTLLDISKLDAGVFKINKSDINVCSLIQRLHQEINEIARKKSLKFWVTCNEQIIINTDTQLLERILRNLIGNAIKYTDKGNIIVSLNRVNNICSISVSDTGQGISIDNQDKIFEEFYQVDNPHRDRAQGLGLGLAIVKRISNMLGYTLSLESKVGEGTTFHIMIDAIVKSMPVDIANSHQNTFNIDDLKVLLVDDDQQVLAGMETLLKSFGCDVVAVDSTRLAAAAVSNFTPDIILADFRLRDGDDGITTIRTIRNLLPGTCALLISGDTAPERLQLANEAGIDLLHKPVLADDLLTNMTRILQEKSDRKETRS